MSVSASALDTDNAPAAAGSSQRRLPGRDPEAAIKSLAKTIARDTTARITDRHLRALVRTDCYNRLVAMLRQIDERRLLQRERQRRIQIVLGGTSLLLATALAVSLLL